MRTYRCTYMYVQVRACILNSYTLAFAPWQRTPRVTPTDVLLGLGACCVSRVRVRVRVLVLCLCVCWCCACACAGVVLVRVLVLCVCVCWCCACTCACSRVRCRVGCVSKHTSASGREGISSPKHVFRVWIASLLLRAESH